MNSKTTQVWFGVARVTPESNSHQIAAGLRGGFGFVAVRAETIDEGIRQLRKELAEGGTRLAGFEWFHRAEDNERELTEDDRALIAKLDSYPVQFKDIHWFIED